MHALLAVRVCLAGHLPQAVASKPFLFKPLRRVSSKPQKQCTRSFLYACALPATCTGGALQTLEKSFLKSSARAPRCTRACRRPPAPAVPSEPLRRVFLEAVHALLAVCVRFAGYLHRRSPYTTLNELVEDSAPYLQTFSTGLHWPDARLYKNTMYALPVLRNTSECLFLFSNTCPFFKHIDILTMVAHAPSRSEFPRTTPALVIAVMMCASKFQGSFMSVSASCRKQGRLRRTMAALASAYSSALVTLPVTWAPCSRPPLATAPLLAPTPEPLLAPFAAAPARHPHEVSGQGAASAPYSSPCLEEQSISTLACAGLRRCVSALVFRLGTQKRPTCHGFGRSVACAGAAR